MLCKRFFLIFFVILVFVFFSVNTYADPYFPQIEKKILNVGFYEMQGAQEIDEEGNLWEKPVFNNEKYKQIISIAEPEPETVIEKKEEIIDYINNPDFFATCKSLANSAFVCK